MRTLQMGSTGDDVKQLQARLNDVGDYGLVVDGRFGPLTRKAVVQFQRDNGLVDDGIVGPITARALGLSDVTSPAQPATPSPARKLHSLHIGVNEVDPAHYDGWDGKLAGCENDAQTIASIAEREGFSTNSLLTSQATAAGVLSAISALARQLASGDMFLLSYAGHGAQVPNVSDDVEVDQQDETWVLHDRMVLDDELEKAFSEFAAGVDIVLLSDSCHSGTVYRKMFDPGQLEYAERKGAFYENVTAPPSVTGGSRSFPVPPSTGGRSGSVARAAKEQRGVFLDAVAAFDTKLKVGSGWKPPGGYVSIFDRFTLNHRGAPSALAPMRFPGQDESRDASSDRGAGDPVVTRNMPLGVNASVVAHHAALYAGIQESSRGHATVLANGLAISGCGDSQLSQESNGQGVFTGTLAEVWKDGTFSGTFVEFHRAIVSRMGPTQTPVLGLWGQDPQSLAAKTPFG